jgi:hypothetical protein
MTCIILTEDCWKSEHVQNGLAACFMAKGKPWFCLDPLNYKDTFFNQEVAVEMTKLGYSKKVKIRGAQQDPNSASREDKKTFLAEALVEEVKSGGKTLHMSQIEAWAKKFGSVEKVAKNADEEWEITFADLASALTCVEHGSLVCDPTKKRSTSRD